MIASHFPCAFKIISTTSRTAPRPPGARVTKCAAAFTSGRASPTATANPARFSGPKSTTSSPTKQTSSQSSFARRKSFSTAPVLPDPVALLDEKINFQFGRAHFRHRRRPRRDPADLEAGPAQKYQAQAVPDVEPLDFLRSADEHRAVGQHAVHVAQEQFDALQAGDE